MRWTPEEKQRVMAMRTSQMKLREIAAHFPGRNLHGVYNLLRHQQEPSCKWARGRFDILARLGQDKEPPPLYLIKEAILRALYPRTPTMRLCGDPVLNQQALFVQTHGERL